MSGITRPGAPALKTIPTLQAISPVDGRYRRDTEPLAEFFSESGLIRNRVRVEVEYLIALSDAGITGRRFTDEEKTYLRYLYSPMTVEEANIVKQIEVRGYEHIKATNHDVKAVEYYLREKMKGTSLSDSLQWVHFGLTSMDTDNIAYALMLRDGIEKVILPKLEKLVEVLDALAEQHADLPMLARTHGQPATPTTFGKEFRVFAERLERQLEQLRDFRLLVKMNGASGNDNARVGALPNVSWLEISADFVNSLNDPKGRISLLLNPITTQIEPHDTYAELFANFRRINTILTNFAQDAWRYISDSWIVQKAVEGEVGSSTMPNKVNPIKFENAEGSLGLANAFFEFFERKLPISRLQRDLSDSTVIRYIGEAFAISLQGYSSLLGGLERISVNESKVRQELASHPEVLAELYQTVLRREGVQDAYELLKDLTRKGEGRGTTMEELREFVNGLNLPEHVKRELLSWTPEKYTGIAGEIAGTKS